MNAEAHRGLMNSQFDQETYDREMARLDRMEEIFSVTAPIETDRARANRNLWIAIGVSFLFHALAFFR